MSDETGTSAIDEITRLVIRYAAGFAGDAHATVEFYTLPMIHVGPDAVSVMGSREEATAFVEGILDRLRPMGFSHTTVERCFVRLLHRSVALCGVDGTRRRADGSPIERIGATLDGILRSATHHAGGSLRDTCVYSITAGEWPAVRSELERRLSSRA